MDGTDKKIADLADQHAHFFRERFLEEVEFLLEAAESPIERLFGAALVAALFEVPEVRFDVRGTGDIGPEGAENYVTSQVRLRGGKYRVDFYVQCATATKVPLKIAIECDGHDFHERTKERAARDRGRDRWLQVHGFRVLRFTGSQIFEDPRACAAEVVDLIYRTVFFA